MQKFAWPPAKGVSKPRQQSPILVTVPFGYWTPGFLEFRKDTIYSILRRGVWASSVRPQRWLSYFSVLQKSLPKSIPFFIDFGSQNAPKIHPKITQNPFPEPSRNQPPKNNKNIQNQTPPNLENRALV